MIRHIASRKLYLKNGDSESGKGKHSYEQCVYCPKTTFYFQQQLK